MSTPSVTLHIGAMKTGTTYVQRMLGSNSEALASSGIMYPMPWSDQVEAVRDTLAMKGGSHLGSIEGCWERMVERLHSWQGQRSILSVEFLSFADEQQIHTLVDDLRPSEVTVVIGARDLARALPAQWQTAVRNGRTTPYRKYIKGITAKRDTGPKQHFWRRQDIGRIAAGWAEHVGRKNVTVVTVPPKGADPSELWRRMATAMQLGSIALVDKTPSNESLGPTATELLRRINLQTEAIEMSTWSYQHGVNRALSHGVLPNIPDPHPSLRVPDDCHDWVQEQSERVVAEIRASGVDVIGDLADLEPHLDPSSPFVWPEELADEEVLSVAVAALTAFAGDVAERKRMDLEGGGRRGGRRKRAGHSQGEPS